MRERLASRLGFIMLAAVCAVGLGNVWRFPFVVGRNGGAAFVAVYLLFLALFGFPLLLAELAVGRGGQAGIAGAFRKLGGEGWGRVGLVVFCGNLLLMAYYTDVAGWLLRFTASYAISGVPPDFAALVGDRPKCFAFMAAAVAASAAICATGLRGGVERAAKWMMLSLLVLMTFLAVRSLSLPGAAKGLAFYLKPDWTPFAERPLSVVFEAMGQAFFTLSIGVGAMTIFGSYIGRGESLVKETAWIIAIDTAVALSAGLIVFPACATYGVDAAGGPGLIFVALPKVFAAMEGGRVCGMVFFLFLSLAALTTVIAVFECLIGGVMDMTRFPRAAVAALVGVVVAAASLPCVMFDGALDWEDFAFSKFWLPSGGMALALFVSYRFGWGWDAFREEASAGRGASLPGWTRPLFRYVVPALVLAVVVGGLVGG
ncbi:MAG: sodium-dependent transporter [Kiritimatiellae bacterium]|nr:sodium-dependent transporter [Kiritimatiellia bacterium]